MPCSRGNSRLAFLQRAIAAFANRLRKSLAVQSDSEFCEHRPGPLPSPASPPSSPPTHMPEKLARTLSRPPHAASKPRSVSPSGGPFKAHLERPAASYCSDDMISTSPNVDPSNHCRRPSRAVQIPPQLPPSPPPAYYPRPTRPPCADLESGPTPPLTSLLYVEIPVYVMTPELLEANLNGHISTLSPTHVMINTLVFVLSAVILGTTITLFYLLHLDERGVPNPAGSFVVLFSAASAASALVVIRRLEKRVHNDGQAAWPSSMAVVVPLMFLACAILAFITFLVGINFNSL